MEKKRMVICDHHEGCWDKECPHIKPHEYCDVEDWDHDYSCGSPECHVAIFGSECIAMEFCDQK